MKMDEELRRIANVYTERDAGMGLGQLPDTAVLYRNQQRVRDTVQILRERGRASVAELEILEVGCGTGAILREFITLGADPARLHGIDLMGYRVAEAARWLPSGVDVRVGDASSLPYADAQFDVVLQYTMLSSVLDSALRSAIVAEMRRVTKAKGLLLSYDFIWNPTNSQTRGLGGSELRSLFGPDGVSLRRVTLAPPIARRLAPISWVACACLERCRVLNSHYLLSAVLHDELILDGATLPSRDD